MDNEDSDMKRLTRYKQYYNISNTCHGMLVIICIALPPDVLTNRCIFQNDAMCMDASNAFFEIDAVRNDLSIAGNIIICARSRRVSIMIPLTMELLNEFFSLRLDRHERDLKDQRHKPYAEMLEKKRVLD
ncbi:hypothetical protein DPMN_170228 [Dreissena polymorpha]|uniref:Uncharacterized protein n=1 Tax=Dreissena polymorpha TaxID=45954 RepID=A0A9D4DVY9_DREPO|nr:hypothetical protein DPMN_170228 [Dreissena polymorpha]